VAQETFLIIINVENSCVIYFFSGLFEKVQIESSKDQHLSEIESLCNIIHYSSKVSKDSLNRSKVTVNTFIKDSISNKCCSFEI